MVKYHNALKSAKIFQGLSELEIKTLIAQIPCTQRTYLKDDIIGLFGDRLPGLAVVVQGEVCITKERSNGERVFLDSLGPSQIFGEMSVFQKPSVWLATVIALKNSTVYFFDFQSYFEATTNAPEQLLMEKKMLLKLLKLYSDKALNLQKKLEIVTLKSVRERLVFYLLKIYEKQKTTKFELSLNRNKLSEYLNVARPTLSRELAQLQKEGLLNCKLSKIELLDVDGLYTFLED